MTLPSNPSSCAAESCTARLPLTTWLAPGPALAGCACRSSSASRRASKAPSPALSHATGSGCVLVCSPTNDRKGSPPITCCRSAKSLYLQDNIHSRRQAMHQPIWHVISKEHATRTSGTPSPSPSAHAQVPSGQLGSRPTCSRTGHSHEVDLLSICFWMLPPHYSHSEQLPHLQVA
jgi:hypothetical protein